MDVPWQAPVTEDLRRTRRYFFRRADMFTLAVVMGTGFFYPALTHVQWQNYGTPILVGALFGIGAGLARLNDRLRPWSDQR